MECPRCGARLTRIALGDRRSVYCEECRFADIESDHTRASAGEETWDDALSRFRTAHAGEATDAESDGSNGASLPVETIDGIGPTYADRLETTSGIESTRALAVADATDVAARIDAPESSVAEWIDRARRIESETAPDSAGDGYESDDVGDDHESDTTAGDYESDSGADDYKSDSATDEHESGSAVDEYEDDRAPSDAGST